MAMTAIGDLFHTTAHGVSIGRRSGAKVWGGSHHTRDAHAKPVSGTFRKQFWRAFRRLRDLFIRKHERGQHGGKIRAGHKELLEALIWRCCNPVTGKIDPPISVLAGLAGQSIATVCALLKDLREWGIINWLRRCDRDKATGKLAQETNLYELCPPEKWLFQPPPEAPPPADHGATRVPDAHEVAIAETEPVAKLAALETEPPRSLGGNPLVHRLASLQRAIFERDRKLAEEGGAA